MKRRLLVPVRGLLLLGLAVVEAAVSVLVVAAGCLLAIGVGLYLFPPAVSLLRAVANLGRRTAQWSGIDIAESYRPPPDGLVKRNVALLKDSATWRDLSWATVDWVIGTWMAALPLVFVVFGAFGAFVQPFVWRAIGAEGGSNIYGVIQVNSTATALACVPIGLVMIGIGFLIGPGMLRLRARWTAVLLSPSRTAELEQRVDTLAGTRAEASDAQAAELRRIERDLHDGAQARLVAMGMSLGNAEELLDADPAAARKLLVSAREASSKALDELRDLVRGIHPPVLADRGLADAIRALALDVVIDAEVAAELDGRPAPPVESAAYFAVSELLTNAAKHSGATRINVALEHHHGTLTCTVVDNGRGGADPSAGSGLHGLQRRLAAFDGTVSIDSPVGGPTKVTLEIPCVLSSPKTSSF